MDSSRKLEQKEGMKTENIQRASWAGRNVSCFEQEISEQESEPWAELEMSSGDVLAVVEQPILAPQAQMDAKAGSNQAEGMCF